MVRPDDRILGADASNLELMRERINGMRSQRNLAVVGFSAVAFTCVVMNAPMIVGLLRPPPELRVNVADESVRAYAELQVVSAPRNEPVGGAIPGRPIEVPAGAYRVDVKLGGDVVWTSSLVQVTRGETRTIDVPPLDLGRMRVVVRGPAESRPHAAMDVSVVTSGLGYLWVYAKRDGVCRRTLPEVGDEPARIRASVAVRFGRDGVPGLLAGEPGEEALLFVVTSSPEEAAATRILPLRCKTAATQVDAALSTENWGVGELAYRVREGPAPPAPGPPRRN